MRKLIDIQFLITNSRYWKAEQTKCKMKQVALSHLEGASHIIVTAFVGSTINNANSLLTLIHIFILLLILLYFYTFTFSCTFTFSNIGALSWKCKVHIGC